MKNITLFFREINASIKENPIIYIVFVFFYVFSTVIAIYVIGKYSSSLSVYDSYDASLTTFSVEYGISGKNFSEIYDTIKKIADSKNVDNIRLRYFDNIRENTDNDTNMLRLYAVSYAKGELEMIEKELKTYGLDDIDCPAFVNSDNSVVVVESAAETSTDHIDIQDVPHKIVGRCAWGENGASFHLVPFRSVTKNTPIIREISIKYNEINSFRQLKEIQKSLEIDFPSAKIQEPVLRNYNIESIFSIGNILVYLVIVLSALNFIYIFKYILEKRYTTYKILFICGCSKAKTATFAGSEILISSIIMSLAGIVLFNLAAKPLIIILEPLQKYTFHSGIYFAVFLASVILSFAVLALEFYFMQRRWQTK